jgi:hypothetical protein
MSIQYQQETFELVESQFDAAQNYADEAWSIIQTLMNDLVDAANFTLDYSDLDLTITPLPITGSFTWAETPYTSTLITNLDTWLRAILVDGATGLGTTVEANIWDRARDRLQVENERVYEEALSFWSARGHALPPGALIARLTRAMAEQTRANQQINYEIAIEQARLAQSNQQHAEEMSNRMIEVLVNNNAGYYTRSLDAAKYAIEGPIRVFEAQVAKMTAQVSLLLEEAKVNLTMALEENRIKIETLKAGAQVAAQLAASSLSAVNASAGVSYRGGYNYGYSESSSQQQSESTHYQYNYYP